MRSFAAPLADRGAGDSRGRRADAMVWAMTELLLGKKRGEPRIRML